MCNSNLSSNPCDQICKKQVAYDKAVEAYQFHVQRYHTWVNYYAIFVGALFVAFYTIIPQSENVQCTPCSGTIFSFLDSIWLPLLIITLGWFASMCWLASIIGHYEWMKSKLCFSLEICRLLLVDSLFRLFTSYGYNWILSLWESS